MSSLPLLVVLAATGSSAFRSRKGAAVGAAEAETGFVSKLWSFGAPPMGNPALEDPRTGSCFPGARFVAQNDRQIDMVPRLGEFAEWITYKMPKVDLVVVDSDQGVQEKGCSGVANSNGRDKTFEKHMFDSYCGTTASNPTLVAGMSSELKDVCWIGFNNSYESDSSKVAQKVASYGQGWELLGHVAIPENLGIWDDVSNLIMNRNTGVCILTFEGSDSLNDWTNNANLWKTTWCGLPQKVHTGISKELMSVVGSRKWQSDIRPKLKQCGEVQVFGHSLGGGMATLFTACANNPNSGRDYGKIGW